MENERYKEAIKLHPRHKEYVEITEMLRLARLGDIESAQVNGQIDLLEGRLSDISVEMAQDIGIPDPRRGNPLWELWDTSWERLRESKRNGRYEEEETIWEELKEIASKLDIQDNFSTN